MARPHTKPTGRRARTYRRVTWEQAKQITDETVKGRMKTSTISTLFGDSVKEGTGSHVTEATFNKAILPLLDRMNYLEMLVERLRAKVDKRRRKTK